jgi:hypothetical protein
MRIASKSQEVLSMTETEQHQEPIKRAVEHAEFVMIAAQQAEELLQDALIQADPKLILSSQARLKQVQHEAEEANHHLLEVNHAHKYDAQLAQVSEELHQVQDDVELAKEASQMPKQVR